MEQAAIQITLDQIVAEADATVKSFRLASLCSAVFRAEAVSIVVVGGSAIEFYTEGAYTSGDLDFCLVSPGSLPLRRRQSIIGKIQAEGGAQLAGFWDVCRFVRASGGARENKSPKN